MTNQEAVEVFELARANNLLPEKIEDLLPLQFIGDAAVKFCMDKVKLIDKLNDDKLKEQRKLAIKDGQNAGEWLLGVEVEVGKACKKEPRLPKYHGRKTISKDSEVVTVGKPPKYERLGMKNHHAVSQAQQVADNPKVVEKIIAQAKENEDIPTKTAVLSEIKYQKEKKRRKEAEGKQEKVKAIVAIEQTQYISALDKCLYYLPQKPPEDWNEDILREARIKAMIIIKRLEVFKND